MNKNNRNGITKSEFVGELSVTSSGQANSFRLTSTINLYKATAFKKGFGTSQRRYETHARQYCEFLIERNLPVTDASFETFVHRYLETYRDAKSVSYLGQVKSITKKFFKFCSQNNILYVLPDPVKRQAVANQMIEAYLAFAQVKKSSKNTYRNALNAFFKFLDERDLDYGYPATMAYLDALAFRELSPFTVSLYINCIKEFSKFLRKRRKEFQVPESHLLSLEAIESIKRPSLGNKVYYKDPLASQEREKLLTNEITPSPAYRLMWSLMAYCGLRAGEVQTLKLRDVDPENSIVWVLGKGKDTKEPARLFEKARTHLMVYLSSEEGKHLPAEGFLFPMIAQGNPGYQKMRKEFRASLERMGLSPEDQLKQRRKVTIHSLRHTCAQLMYEVGNAVEVIQMQLRHSKIDSTMVYANKVIREEFLNRIIE